MISKALIPSYLFDSINYSLTDTNHFNYLRNEVYNVADKLSYVMVDQYKTTKMVYIFKAQLVSDTFNMNELNDITSKVSE